ncbi:MAG TPA: DNA-deoxyinosine glycosylase [Ruminococcus sp.]|nr:DNA-deoxyinosine glycosylase [Ruminococcus sp.]
MTHPFPPLYDAHSEILILGSFPSVKSREQQFFYGHPQNRFWRVTAAVFQENVPVAISEKTAFLLRNHIALWDVIGQCDICGSSDSSIRNVMPNDLMPILQHAAIRRVFVNGGTAAKYYQKYQLPVTGIPAVQLPSTSPANAAWTLPKLIGAWQIIRENEKNSIRL